MAQSLQIAFHIGVHTTDEDRLLRSLFQNRPVLHEHGIEVSANLVNEPILNEALNALKGGVASPEMEDVVLDALLEGESPNRLVLSRATLLGVPRRVLSDEGLLPQMSAKMLSLANVVPSAEAQFFLALKNPATLIGHMIRRAVRSYDELMGQTDPLSKRWAPTLRDAVSALRGRRLVVWCHEDMPMIYPEVLRRLSGLPDDIPLKGTDRLLRSLLTPAGQAALPERLPPHLSIPERRAATEALLAEFGLHDELWLPIECDGWTQQTIDDLTATYRRDVAEIAAMPGVEFILP